MVFSKANISGRNEDKIHCLRSLGTRDMNEALDEYLGYIDEVSG